MILLTGNYIYHIYGVKVSVVFAVTAGVHGVVAVVPGGADVLIAVLV